MTEVAILGLGLMGGSLGLALRAGGQSVRVRGYARREVTRREALAGGVVDEVFDSVAEAIEGADRVVICVPILTTGSVLEGCLGALKDGCLVTDVGSTKVWVVEHMRALLAGTGAQFIGSHPICGSEQTGIDAAREDLYRDALVVVTPSPDQEDSPEVRTLCALWAGVGSRVHTLSPLQHDQMLARTSHLPHMIAAVLAAVVGRDDPGNDVGPYCGTGFRDSTRIAAGSPAVWMDILRTNRPPVRDELRMVRERLDRLIVNLEQERFDEIGSFLAEAKDIRERCATAQEGRT